VETPETVTKSELIERISEQLKLPNGKAEQIVNCVFDSMVKALQEGEGIEIRGFGSFTVREYKSYEGRNPRTGETVHVAPKRLPFFKVGKDLRERVNASLDDAPAPRARDALDALDALDPLDDRPALAGSRDPGNEGSGSF
jgi:integration host factor subunit beta